MATTALSGHFVTKIKPATSSLSIVYIKSAPYSSDGNRPNLAAYKRGTGGRASFNGMVATVFGCTGFVGRYVVNKLGKCGAQIICPYRGDFYDAQRLKVAGDLGQVLFTAFDVRDEESIAKSVQYSNVVINLLGRDYETKNFKYKDIHVDAPRRIARISREMGVERFIHVSYLNQSPNPVPLVLKKPSEYKISKYWGECAVREEFPTATIIRATDIYGSEDRFLRSFASAVRINGQYMPLWKNGEATIKAPVYVSDVAQGIINAIRDSDTKCQVYQAAGPRKYLLSDLVDWFYGLMRKDADWGYQRYDMKYDKIFFPLKVMAVNMISPAYPLGGLHWEAIEKFLGHWVSEDLRDDLNIERERRALAVVRCNMLARRFAKCSTDVKEATSDAIDDNLPTLEDLGVKLTFMEDQVPWELKPYRAHQYYMAKLGEFPTPPDPKIQM